MKALKLCSRGKISSMITNCSKVQFCNKQEMRAVSLFPFCTGVRCSNDIFVIHLYLTFWISTAFLHNQLNLKLWLIIQGWHDVKIVKGLHSVWIKFTFSLSTLWELGALLSHWQQEVVDSYNQNPPSKHLKKNLELPTCTPSSWPQRKNVQSHSLFLLAGR